MFVIKIIKDKEFWKGLKYYLSKDGQYCLQVRPGGLVKNQFLDGKFITKKIDDEEVTKKLLEKNRKIAKSNGYSSDDIPDLYAYAVNLYGEVLKMYEVHNQSDPKKEEVRVRDMRDVYRGIGLSDEEIDEGERRLTICEIRDGIKESRDDLLIGVLGVISVILTFIVEKSMTYSLLPLKAIMIPTLIMVITFLLYNIKKILYYRDKLLNGLEPEDEKRKVLSKSIFKYLKEEKKEKKRQ